MADDKDIKKALQELDSSNDAHWTDDGLPRVDVVQTLLKDPTITRKDIRAAAATFARASRETTEPEDVLPGEKPDAELNTAISAQAAENADLDHPDGLNLDPADPLNDTGNLDEGQLRELMLKRIEQAKQRLDAARLATRDAQEYERKCAGWSDKAKVDFNRRFPPLHPSDAIKAHLKSQLDQRYLAAGLTPPKPGEKPTPASAIDAIMGVRKKMGRVYQPTGPTHITAG